MRRFLLAAVMFGAASCAHAADLPDLPVLRGSFPEGLSTATRNWDGWYAGGQADFTSGSTDFSHSIAGLTNFMFRNSVLQQPLGQITLLSKTAPQGTGFGAFVGRNYQWDDLVFGFEANYTYLTNLASSSTNSISRSIVNPPGDNPPSGHTHTYNVTLAGNASVQVKDVVALRGRAGWATGNFLPYVFGGVAVGRMDVARQVTSTGTLQDDFDVTTQTVVGAQVISTTVHQRVFSPLTPLVAREERINSFVAGWTGGLGLEYMLWNCVFLRGEWEYVKFVSVKDTAVSMNSARLGIGYKF